MYKHLYTHREKYKGALLCLGLQCIVAACWAYVLYAHYETITVNESMTETFVPKDIVTSNYTENIVLGDTSIKKYDGMFGTMQLGDKYGTWTQFHHTHMHIKDINIDIARVEQFLFAHDLYKNGAIDPYIVRFMTQATPEKYSAIVRDMQFVQRYTPNILIQPQSPDAQKKISEKLTHLETLITNKQYEELFGTIQWYQTELDSLPSTKQSLTANFVSSAEFTYLLDKIHTDTDNFYASHIQEASERFDINPSLIKSAILTEQLRWFFTYRWLMKQVIASQKYMMVMQQMSRWIWWIKAKTARDIEEYIATNHPDYRRDTFAFDSTAWQAIDNERYARLTDIKNYYRQIMYVAANLAMNADQRQEAGTDIRNNPWVLLTLYNIWARPPHDNPDIGWAALNIDGQQFSFGWLAMMIYYVLEMYG